MRGQQNNGNRRNHMNFYRSPDSLRLERMERRQINFINHSCQAMLGLTTLVAAQSDHLGVKVDPNNESFYGYYGGDPVFDGRKKNPRENKNCEVFMRPKCKSGATCPIWDSPLGCWFWHPGGWRYSVFYIFHIFWDAMGGGLPCVRYHAGVGGLPTHPVSVVWVRAQWCSHPPDTFHDTWHSWHCTVRSPGR